MLLLAAPRFNTFQQDGAGSKGVVVWRLQIQTRSSTSQSRHPLFSTLDLSRLLGIQRESCCCAHDHHVDSLANALSVVLQLNK
jgi:hypothetical protein